MLLAGIAVIKPSVDVLQRRLGKGRVRELETARHKIFIISKH